MKINVLCQNPSKEDVDTPDLDSLYNIGYSHDQTTFEHHYHFNIFNEVIDLILKYLMRYRLFFDRDFRY